MSRALRGHILTLVEKGSQVVRAAIRNSYPARRLWPPPKGGPLPMKSGSGRTRGLSSSARDTVTLDDSRGR